MNRSHLDDGAVNAVALGHADAEARYGRHLADCAACRLQVRDAIAVRSFASRASSDDVTPERDIAARVMATIRSRTEAVASVNETVGSLGSVARSLMHFVFGRRT